MPQGLVLSEGEGSTPAAISTGRAMLVLVISLFFIWGGITSLNDVLVPKLKGLFRLSYAQAMLVQFAFFTAYATVSLPAGAAVSRLGYGRGIAGGLAIAAIGCLMFAPAAAYATYPLFLVALFVLAAGLTVLQVAANPLIANLGSAATSHSRLTFAQAFNSLGTTIMPFLGARLVLSSVAPTSGGAPRGVSRAGEAAVLGHAYLGLALVLAASALVFWSLRARLGRAAGRSAKGLGLQLRRHPRLAFGVLAMFAYVGAEVTVGSLMTNYLMLPKTLGLDAQRAGEHLAFFWGGALIGRFAGAGLLRLAPPGKVLAAASAAALALIAVSSVTGGWLSAWSLIALGLTNSIMFPTIFSLAVENLGPDTPRGSGLLCMAIVGGAVVPLFGGYIADALTLTAALAAPAACYGVIAAFGWFARRPAPARP